MAQQTAVGWLTDQIKEHKKKFGIPPTEKGYMNLIEQAKQIEKEQMKNAVMYGLDEDGHTGDWKIKFANDFITKYYSSNEAESTPNDL